MTTRHPNCKPMQISERAPAVSLSGQTKRGLRAEIERDVADYLKRGKKIQKLRSEVECTLRHPAFDYLAAESGSLG